MFKHKGKLFILLLLTVMLAGCVEGDPVNEEGSNNDSGSEDKDSLVIAQSTDARIMDPGNATDEGDMDIIWNMFDGLVQYKNEDLEVEPALATDWKSSEDGKTWTFNLREDVTFHDGTDFNADAVVESFMRLFDEDHPYFEMIQGSYSYTEFLLGDVLEDVEAVDEYTVAFHLNQRFAPFLTYMGYYSQFIVSPTALEEKGEDFLNHPVGTGAYEFVKWNKDQSVELKKNEDYWGDEPDIDKLVFKVVPESSTRLLELKSGDIGVIKNMTPDQMEDVEDTDGLAVDEREGTNIFDIAINTTKEPFDDKKVRQALNYAVNAQRIIDTTYQGNATKAINFLPQSIAGFDESTGSYDYDPEKAKELLKEAGYEDGFSMSINAFQGARPYVSDPVQAAELVADDLKEVGLDVEIETNEWANHSDIMESLDHDMALHGYFDIGYASNFLKTMALEGSNTGFESEELNDLALEALKSEDVEQENEIYKELQSRLHEEAIMIPIAHNNYSIGINDDIEGLTVDNAGIIHAKDATLK